MPRRIWIIAKKDQVEQSDIDDAQANNCPEIVNGIPPALEGVIDEASLPIAFEEPEPPLPPEPRNLEAEIDEIKAKMVTSEPPAEMTKVSNIYYDPTAKEIQHTGV